MTDPNGWVGEWRSTKRWLRVDETDIGKIRPGMRATVSVAAYPNQPFPGDVTKIEPQAVIEQNVTMFAVLISPPGPRSSTPPKIWLRQ